MVLRRSQLRNHWRWPLVGVVVGLIVGAVLRWLGPWYDSGRIESIDIGAFERLVNGTNDGPVEERPPVDGLNQPAVRALIVHPPVDGDLHAQWITGERHALIQRRAVPGDIHSPLDSYAVWTPFKVRVPVPFQVFGAESNSYPTVADYLMDVQKYRNQAIVFRSAWWERAPADLLLPAGVGLAGIGILWPLGLWLVRGGQSVVDESVASPLSAVAGGDGGQDPSLRSSGRIDLEPLAAVNDAYVCLGQGTPTTADPDPQADSAGASQPAGVIPLDPLQPVPAVESPPVDYDGEFYPVARAGRR